MQQAEVALARSQPSTQHSQVQALHLHVPVSQQPQQSHLGQPALFTLTAAAPKGTTARVAQRSRLFIAESPYRRKLNSETPCRNTRHRQHISSRMPLSKQEAASDSVPPDPVHDSGWAIWNGLSGRESQPRQLGRCLCRIVGDPYNREMVRVLKIECGAPLDLGRRLVPSL